MRINLEGQLAAGHRGQGHHPAPDRRTRRRRRQWLRGRVRRQRNPRPADGRSVHGLQHVGRVRRAFWHDLRPTTPCSTIWRAAPTRRKGDVVGCRGRRLAASCRRDADANFDRESASISTSLAPQVTWGNNPEAVLPSRRANSRSGQRTRPPAPQGDGSGARLHGPEARAMRSKAPRSTGSSSAHAPTVVFPICALRPRSSRDARLRQTSRAWAVPGSTRRQAAGRSRRSRPDFPCRRLRMARARLLHVPWRQWRHCAERLSAASRPRTAILSAAKARAAARISQVRRWPQLRRAPGTSPIRANSM